MPRNEPAQKQNEVIDHSRRPPEDSFPYGCYLKVGREGHFFLNLCPSILVLILLASEVIKRYFN